MHRRLLIPLTAVILLGSCASVEPFSQLPDPPPRAEALLLIIHGSMSGADEWPLDLESAILRTYGPRSNWEIQRLEWGDISERRLTGAGQGRRLGRALAAEVMEQGGYRLIQMVAHSLGAHVVHGMTEEIRAIEDAEGVHDSDRVVIHQTFLDAFIPHGLLAWGFGSRVFGRKADFAESYLTTDDPAFLTNAYLQHGHNFDLSFLLPAGYADPSISPHDLPVRFYVRTVTETVETGPGFTLSPYVWAAELDRAELLAAYELLLSLYPAGAVTPEVVD